QSSTFLNNTRLDLKEAELEDGDIIQVNQVGSSETIFRESAQYEYQKGKLVRLPDAPDRVETGRNAFADQDKDSKKEKKDE
ncbi:MAG: FHA domain-containing protein, partial [[Ruminococcus] gnavus]|nr:FHA domain-containing protein [Mediterraneibacter gnavus]